MDSIDITDAAFTLGITEPSDIISGGSKTDYTMFIYIGAAILIIFIGMIIYKYYQNKRNNENSQLDCEGGFCTMNQQQMPTNESNQYEH
jgi:hypothetical protein